MAKNMKNFLKKKKYEELSEETICPNSSRILMTGIGKITLPLVKTE